MALTRTSPIELGFKAPDFSLPDVVSGKTASFSDVKGEKGTLVMFICNHCPYVIHVLPEIIRLAHDFMKKGIGIVAISANDASSYPQDGPGEMRRLALEENFPFPYLYDESQQTAKDYHAVCTPEFNLFDGKDRCVYRGRLDASTPGNNVELSGNDLRYAIDTLLKGKQIEAKQEPAMGCSIKWKNAEQ